MSDTQTRAKKLFDLGAHLGHRKNRLHPRSRPFVYQIIDGVSVIDLEKTIQQIDAAKQYISTAGHEGKGVLVVATKKSFAAAIGTMASQHGMFSITTKWLPGLLTNFDTITKNVQKLKELKRQRDAGEWQRYVKHEQVALEKEVRKLEKLYGGIEQMTKLPDVLIVIDIRREKNAITESQMMKIPVVAIVDTNCNPDDVAYPIIMNDDAPEAVQAVIAEIIEGYQPKPEDSTENKTA
jgi:small subunit ribosomal protein S2